jgi:hypothetical protein
MAVYLFDKLNLLEGYPFNKKTNEICIAFIVINE